jgi:hypothetical protein
MKPQLGQPTGADMPHMDARQVHGATLALGSGVHESDHMVVAGEDVVHLRAERSSGELGDLPEVAPDLVLSAVLAGHL